MKVSHSKYSWYTLFRIFSPSKQTVSYNFVLPFFHFIFLEIGNKIRPTSVHPHSSFNEGVYYNEKMSVIICDLGNFDRRSRTMRISIVNIPVYFLTYAQYLITEFSKRGIILRQNISRFCFFCYTQICINYEIESIFPEASFEVYLMRRK